MFSHTPVLLEETMGYLTSFGGRRFVDATVGGGGHSWELLHRLPEAEVLGLDRDEEAIEAAAARCACYGDRFRTYRTAFSHLEDALDAVGWDEIDGVLMDIGVSSHQIDEASRGFSFRFDGPLDMRMDRRGGKTAADLLNTLSEAELADIFYRYGEERKSRRVAAEVVHRRQERLWERTGEFSEMLERVVGRSHQHGLPPATRCFQALRIAVNDELGELERCLASAARRVRVGGRIAVISFHSLEDRIVKEFFREGALSCTCPPGLPVCVCHKVQTLEILTRKPVEATEEEIGRNSRSGCAKLRVASVKRHE